MPKPFVAPKSRKNPQPVRGEVPRRITKPRKRKRNHSTPAAPKVTEFVMDPKAQKEMMDANDAQVRQQVVDTQPPEPAKDFETEKDTRPYFPFHPHKPYHPER